MRNLWLFLGFVVIAIGLLCFPFHYENLTTGNNLKLKTSVSYRLFWKSVSKYTISNSVSQYDLLGLTLGNTYHPLSEDAIKIRTGYAWLWADQNSPKVAWVELDTTSYSLYLNLRHRQILNWDVNLAKKSEAATPIEFEISKNNRPKEKIALTYPLGDTTSGRLLLLKLEMGQD